MCEGQSTPLDVSSQPFTVISLCSGVGGLDLAIQRMGGRTVVYSEINPYRQEILLRRMEEGWLDVAPIISDLTKHDFRPWRGIVDCIIGGFPCQPFSIAGQRRGSDDSRNLFPHVYRILCEVRPRFALLENVPGLIHTPYWGTILGDLAEGGFNVQWDCIPAAAAGAPHRRDRLWIVITDASSR